MEVVMDTVYQVYVFEKGKPNVLLADTTCLDDARTLCENANITDEQELLLEWREPDGSICTVSYLPC
jgi:hypothetical protein